jgi:hypothetical protein
MQADQTLLSALTASMQAEQLGPGGPRSSEKAIFLRQLLQAHPLNGQTALHAAAFLGQQEVIDMLLGHGAPKDTRFFMQTGDGLGERDREFFFGERARDAFFFGASTLPAQAAAYQAAIRASPQNLEAYLRLASVQALLEARSAQCGDGDGWVGSVLGGSAAETWRQAWMLEHEDGDQDEGDETAHQDAYVAMKRSNALAGADASGRVMSVPARTLADLSVHLDQPLALQRALSLWRQQGVVVFPAMLAPEAVHKLACHVRAAVAPVHAVPRIANIRNPDFRTLRGLHVRGSSAALEAIAHKLAPFLREALEDHELEVLEHAAYGVGTGAEQQKFHRDDSIVDSRVVSIQISLVDTSGEQGAFQVLAATHHGAARAGEEGQEVNSLDELGLLGVDGVQGIVVAVPAGTVVMYSPNAMHRGRGNDTDKERVSLTLTLMGANGLVPEGIPLAICLEDEGKWYLDVARAQGHLMHRVTSSTLDGGQSEHPTSGNTIQMGARSPWI